MSRIETGQLLWTPSAERLARSHLTRYLAFLEQRGRKFAGYEALWRWRDFAAGVAVGAISIIAFSLAYRLERR